MTERCYALVPAAGSGSRSGQAIPKQYVELAGRPLIAHTLAALRAVDAIAQTLVVLAPDDERFAGACAGFDGWTADCGGATRAASVLAGLGALRERGVADRDWVLVHDAARCLIRPAWVQQLIDACRDDVVGGLLALPVADTLKRSDGEQRVGATLDRAGAWAAQTPQMFRLGLLEKALREAGDAVTDEASAIEHLGLRPRLVRAPLENFKLTLAEDFALAELILQGRERP